MHREGRQAETAPGGLSVDRDAGRRADGSCLECGGVGWKVIADGGAGLARRCDCQKQDLRRQLLAGSGLPERYRRCHLNNFKTSHADRRIADRLQQALRTSELYVENFFDGKESRFRESGLLYVGPPGGGKTHLAAAVLSELIQRYGVQGRFVDFTTLVHQIQSTFDPGSAESAHQILDPVIDAEVLVLDELGAQKPTEWVMNTLYLIMNTRYTQRRPTLFTTNYLLDDETSRSRASHHAGVSDHAVSQPPASDDHRRPELLSTRISAVLVSRLYEMAMPVRFPDWDYRREVKSHRHRVGL